jgi:hypothetical protein
MVLAGIALAVMAGSAGGAVQGQRQTAAPAVATIELGTTALALGMPQQKVIDALAGWYVVEKQPGSSEPFSSWMIRTRGAPSAGVPATTLANLGFKDGKLFSVFKYWGPEDQQKGAALASALYGALAQLIKEGRRSCVIDTATNQTPQAEMKSAFIVCGGKYIEVSITRQNGDDFASITETLRSEK